MIDPGRLAEVLCAVSTAARKAFSAVREAHPDEDFYYYVLWTTGAVHRPAPCACSAQGLARVMKEYGETDPANLRWSEADSPYDCFGDQHFAEVEAIFSKLGDPYDRTEDARKALLNAVVGAMQDLDSNGFFGTGAEREKVVINVSMPGEENEDQLIERARLLNPVASLQTLVQDYSDSEQDAGGKRD